MGTNKKELLKACKDGTLYDFIANNYWQMTNDELKDVCLEAIYIANNDEEIANGLEDRWEE